MTQANASKIWFLDGSALPCGHPATLQVAAMKYGDLSMRSLLLGFSTVGLWSRLLFSDGFIVGRAASS